MSLLQYTAWYSSLFFLDVDGAADWTMNAPTIAVHVFCHITVRSMWDHAVRGIQGCKLSVPQKILSKNRRVVTPMHRMRNQQQMLHSHQLQQLVCRRLQCNEWTHDPCWSPWALDMGWAILSDSIWLYLGHVFYMYSCLLAEIDVLVLPLTMALLHVPGNTQPLKHSTKHNRLSFLHPSPGEWASFVERGCRSFSCVILL